MNTNVLDLPLKAALIGAGERGLNNFGSYALHHPDKFKFTAVCDIDPGKRVRFAGAHKLSQKNQFENYNDLLSQKDLFDVVFISTMDRAHSGPAILALERGFPLMLEKPIGHDLESTLQILKTAEKTKTPLQVVFPLRYTAIFQRAKLIIHSGRLGKIFSVSHTEYVDHIHFSHSFVRGNWGNSEKSTPSIVQKCCHDMDILFWLINDKPVKVSSFGNLSFFNESGKPGSVPLRCLDGCEYENLCPYSVHKIYLKEKTSWPVCVVSIDSSLDARTQAIQDGPYGRCVFQCDNNVCDHQHVLIEFESGIIADLRMEGLSPFEGRVLEIQGTKGHLSLSTIENTIRITSLSGNDTEEIRPEIHSGSHLGGDELLLTDWFKDLTQASENEIFNFNDLLYGHLLAFNAEKARVNDMVIKLNENSGESKCL